MDLLYVVGFTLWATCKALVAGFIFVTQLVLGPFVRVLANSLETRSARKALNAATKTHYVDAARAVSVPVDAVAAAVEAREGPTTVMLSHLEPADRIERVMLGDVAVLFARVFIGRGIIKQELRIRCSELRYLLNTNLLLLPDVPYDRKLPVKRMLERLGADAKAHLEKIATMATGEMPGRSAAKRREDNKQRAAAPKQEAVQSERVQQPPPAAQQATQLAAQPVPERPSIQADELAQAGRDARGRSVVPSIQTGYTYVGKLMEAGSTMKRPPNKDPYTVFEATLLLENGAELPLRGAELERALQRAQVQLGDKVAVTPMGKLPVTLAGGKEGMKNLYAVVKMDARKG